MDDLELLKFAAVAIGSELVVLSDGSTNLQYDGGTMNWNPLKSDGDALRLAVRLGLMLDVSHNDFVAVGGATPCEMLEFHNGNKNIATRRAVVRAAAKIGREM